MTRCGSGRQEHPSVAIVEHILTLAAAKSTGHVPTRHGRAVVDRAVWFCACVTLEDAPTWLIYEAADGKIGWCRVGDGEDVDDLVDAQLATGSHVDPVEVLNWLENPDASQVPGDGSADETIVRELGRSIPDLRSG